MAFGFSPKHVQDFPFGDVDKAHFLVLAIESATRLGWTVSFISASGFVAYTRFSWSSWSEEVTFKLHDSVATIKSESTGSQLMDWGKNKKNMEKFFSAYEEVKGAISPEDMERKYLD